MFTIKGCDEDPNRGDILLCKKLDGCKNFTVGKTYTFVYSYGEWAHFESGDNLKGYNSMPLYNFYTKKELHDKAFSNKINDLINE